MRIIHVSIDWNQIPLFWIRAWELSIESAMYHISSCPITNILKGPDAIIFLQHLSTADAADSTSASGSPIA